MTSDHAADHSTMTVARWVAGLTYADLPERTRSTVRSALLDTVGCGVYGYGTPWTQKLLQWAQAGGGRGRSRAWGAGQPRMRAADAALVNGTSAHAFELDDYHNAKLHPGAAVIPAVLAVAEEHDAPGERIVTAIAAGYEVMIRTSLALDPSAARLRGWHLTGVCGPLGAAAACAVLFGFNAEHTAWALGLAGTQGSGLWAFNADGAMSKRLHAGKAAQSGVVAAELARLGFTGPTRIYEYHDGGFLKAYSDAADTKPLTDALGSTWHLEALAVKPYSCCASTHAYIDAALALRRKAGDEWDPATGVRVGLSKVVDVQCGFDYEPTSALNAQMSVRYAVAAALIDGQVLPEQFTDEKLRDTNIVGVARDIELHADPELDKLYPAHFAGWVAARVKGNWERVDILDPTGSPAAPVDAAGLLRKFSGINPALPAERIASVALNIERHSARELLDLLAPAAGARAAA
jgi:2-methylcitrate dehydratase PrpD